MQFESPNHLFIRYETEILCEAYEAGKLNGKLKEVASKLTEEDCHVLAICKLKD